MVVISGDHKANLQELRRATRLAFLGYRGDDVKNIAVDPGTAEVFVKVNATLGIKGRIDHLLRLIQD
ncbi:MAG: hypothetical protein A3J06_00185 [Candidatus Moranbacteria bacterium RIFCSPLOWO2_02_FULL_48_19]|nr:MAG: hypothetical protein A3J06_00185 [Candidatus Moranbacteria bacterium RIFCSPLOWO2_02_FULL_48_19]OGI30045.1 MAG: hypothetical protein A3G09_01405 [Candidatus Moranbacteria bacterium RIFCSPLOWO2_12_FULL_48_12]